MTRAATAAAGFAVGWYGKVPGAGDFIARRIPASFREPWDRWLSSAIDASRGRLGPGWRDAYLSMPPWRFILGGGVMNANAWAGLMLPSVDAVGRAFPLTLACALPAGSIDAAATLAGAARWFAEIEEIALTAIAPRTDTAAIDAALMARRFEPRWLREAGDAARPARSTPPRMVVAEPGAAVSLREPSSAWQAEASELFGRTLLLCEALPSGEQFCAMMNGHWLAHGWECPSPSKS